MPTKSKEAPKWDHMAWVKTRRVKRQKSYPDRKIFTGFCNSGHCEGTRPKSYRGSPIKTCAFYLTCDCRCHVDQDEMFEAVGMERRLVDNPEYKPARHTFVMPDPAEFNRDNGGQEKRTGPIDKKAIEGEPLTPESILKGHVFRETDSGRRTKGQLEYQVLEACNKAMDIWPDDVLITPKEVAIYIGKKSGSEPPSSGAVDAVWKRWVNMGFAKVASRPVRFLDYAAEENQTIEQLETAKQRYRNRTVSQARRSNQSIRRK